MRLFTPAVLLAAFVPTAAVAQTWSPEQQEVLSHITACWDAWRTKDFERWTSTCRPVENFTHWQAAQGSPDRLDTWRKIAENDWRVLDVEYGWYEVRPIAVQLSGDVAVVHFYAYSATTVDGQQSVREEKRSEVFRRINGQWALLGGMRLRVSPP